MSDVNVAPKEAGTIMSAGRELNAMKASVVWSGESHPIFQARKQHEAGTGLLSIMPLQCSLAML
jgi:hypothetical protein